MPEHLKRYASGILDRRANYLYQSVSTSMAEIVGNVRALGLGVVLVTNNSLTRSIDADVRDSADGVTYTSIPDSALKLASISPGETRRYELPLIRKPKLQVRGMSTGTAAVEVEIWSAVGEAEVVDVSIPVTDLIVIAPFTNTDVIGSSSPEGTNWSDLTFPAGKYSDIAWNGSTGVAVGPGGNCATTEDGGLTWTSRSMPNGALVDWISVAHNGTVFCAVAQTKSNAVTDKCATSTDGITWVERTMSQTSAWTKIRWNGTVFLAISTTINLLGTTKAATSADGITWANRVMPSSNAWGDVEWTGSLYVAVAYGTTHYGTSPDGIVWTDRTLPDTTDSNSIAIAWNGSLLVILCGASNYVFTSASGTAWSKSAIPTVSGNGDRLTNARALDSLFIAATNSSGIYTGTDGVNWTLETTSAGASWGGSSSIPHLPAIGILN